MRKQSKICIFCRVFSKFYTNNENIYVGAARHARRARHISELWLTWPLVTQNFWKINFHELVGGWCVCGGWVVISNENKANPAFKLSLT